MKGYENILSRKPILQGANGCTHGHNDKRKTAQQAEAVNGDIVLGISSIVSWQIHRWYHSVGDVT